MAGLQWLRTPQLFQCHKLHCSNTWGIGVKTQHISIILLLVMLTLYFVPGRARKKPLDEISPSDSINSVEWGEKSPPINHIVPPSPSTGQHKWFSLSSTSRSEVGVKAPVSGFIFRQDCVVEERQQPPQRRSRQRLCKYLVLPGRSARRQEWRVWGLKTSTLTPTVLLGKPAVMITPGTKCIHILVQTKTTLREYIYNLSIFDTE